MTHGDRSRESLKALANWRITGAVPMSSGKMISRTAFYGKFQTYYAI